MGLQPVLKGSADEGTDRVFADDVECVGERQLYQFVNRLALTRSFYGVGGKGGKLDGIRGVGVLGQQEVMNA